MASASSVPRLSPQPETVACMRAPPISSSDTFSPTTISAIRGLPRYIDALPSTMMMTSQKLGMQARPPAEGPTRRRRPAQAAALRHLARQGDLVVEVPPGALTPRQHLSLGGDARAGAV